MRIFVDRLQERASELGLSQAEVARLQPDLATLVRIAKSLQTTPNWLLGVEPTEDSDTRGHLSAKISATCQAMDLQRLGIAVTLIDALATHDDVPGTGKTSAKPRARRAKP